VSIRKLSLSLSFFPSLSFSLVNSLLIQRRVVRLPLMYTHARFSKPFSLCLPLPLSLSLSLSLTHTHARTHSLHFDMFRSFFVTTTHVHSTHVSTLDGSDELADVTEIGDLSDTDLSGMSSRRDSNRRTITQKSIYKNGEGLKERACGNSGLRIAISLRDCDILTIGSSSIVLPSVSVFDYLIARRYRRGRSTCSILLLRR